MRGIWLVGRMLNRKRVLLGLQIRKKNMIFIWYEIILYRLRFSSHIMKVYYNGNTTLLSISQ